jgi:UDP-glucose 4-epimerase
VNRPSILLTGGAGYIGSHTFVALHAAGFAPVVLDELLQQPPRRARALERITKVRPRARKRGRAGRRIRRDGASPAPAAGVVHFAGSKAVGESVAQPLKYFDNNIGGAISLLRAMETAGRRAPPHPGVFQQRDGLRRSGDGAITEDFPRSHTNPYGHTKLVIEDMLLALQRARPEWRIAILRYFNPVGRIPAADRRGPGRHPEQPDALRDAGRGGAACAPERVRRGLPDAGRHRGARLHPRGRPRGRPCRRAAGLFAGGELHGQPGHRDAGTACCRWCVRSSSASGRKVPYEIVARRPGDVAQCYADPSLARRLLGWEARKGIDEMCADAWRWQEGNPKGYAG